jgi:hypothetical protein
MALPPTYNLICSDGHRWHATEPMTFVDRDCGLKMREGGTCHKKLLLNRDVIKKPKPDPRKKARRKAVKMRRY